MSPARRGVLKYLTIHPDAVQALKAMARGPRSEGELISTLILLEEQRRMDCQRWREQQLAGAEEVGSP
jgi:hypothetical protein